MPVTSDPLLFESTPVSVQLSVRGDATDRTSRPGTLFLSPSGPARVQSDDDAPEVIGRAQVNAAEAAGVRGDLYVVNGNVVATLVSGNTLYLGGDFTRIGPPTGCGVPIDAVSGLPVAGFPKVVGYIETVQPDGAGGWYIGGGFTSVAGVPRSNLAHILADNSVSSWNPNADNWVYTMAIDGNSVYVGGSFANVGGQPRNRIAALDASTGLATVWDPNANGLVSSLAVAGSTIYAGGYFTGIGGAARNRLAALDAATGVAAAWDPNADNSVRAIALSGSVVYVGGEFTDVGGQPRNRIAALDANTGSATSWNPNATGFSVNAVYGLAVSGATLYAGGFFSNIGGQPRNFIAGLDTTTGLATAWNPNANNTVVGLAVAGSTTYAAGSFTNIGGQARNSLAALDASSGFATAWNPNIAQHPTVGSTFVSAVAVSGSTVYAGGTPFMIGGAARNRLAALDLATGLPTAWDPNASATVRALAMSGSTIYAGGDFSSVGGYSRFRAVALDATTGQPSAWAPSPSAGIVRAVAVSGPTVFLGGDQMGNGCLAVFDATSGSRIDIGTTADSAVFALTLSGGTLFVGGSFDSWGAVTRHHIAALDATTGLLAAWDPGADATVRALAVSGATVYAGGYFGNIGGQSRNGIAALDMSSGLATAWDPNANGVVRAITVNGPYVYAGGFFTSIGGQPRNYLAALDPATGLAGAWAPQPDWILYALAASGNAIYAGGGFYFIGGLPQSGIAAIEDATVDVPAPPVHGFVTLLQPSRPNPFASSTVIQFSLAAEQNVTLEVFDTSGREVAALLVNERRGPGLHRVEFRGPGLPSGIYLVRMRAGGVSDARKIVLMR